MALIFYGNIMKNTLYALLLICFCGIFIFAKPDSSAHRFDNNVQYGRLRASKNTSLVLSTTPQKLIWSGTSAIGLNINTFSPDPMGSGNQLVMNNQTTGQLTFYNTADINYFIFFTCNVTNTLLTTPTDVRIRVTIPNGVSAGVDLHYPDPDVSGYADLGPCSYISATAFNIELPLYVSQIVRTNGAYIEIFLSNGTLGTVTMTSATFNLLSGAPTN